MTRTARTPAPTLIPASPLIVSIDDARRMLGGVARSTVYKLIAAGDLDVVKIGRRTRITVESIGRLIATRMRIGRERA